MLPLRLGSARPLPSSALVRAPDLPSLTGLRWVTAMMIFLYHVLVVSYFADPWSLPWMTVFFGGTAGVTVFFILSGFVLAWGSRPHQRVGSFYVRRLARVYPLHLVALALALVTAATFVPGIRTHGAAPLGANLLLVSAWNPVWWQAGNPVSWSLVCEAFFYLLFPLLIRLLSGRTAPTFAVVSALAFAVMLFAPSLAAASPVPMSASATPLLRLPEFVIGMTAALLLRQHQWRPPRPRIAVPLAVLGYSVGLLPDQPDDRLQIVHAIGALAFAILIASLAAMDAGGGRTFLAGPAWQALGRASFAFYLVHVLVMASISSPWPGGHPLLPWPAATALMVSAFCAALALALVLHHGIEIPAQRILTRLDRSARVA
ncbi:peptidoglycan/LPS O-acetylase OafA/YrhL [Clavibacter michiganensis]|uniref:acyltransferase family protein n=1 Tax=Clavibacter michiganensis TaxID=28447 RepID=UPI0019562167|nr:acyltransferase [Clavibacter michiganensis]MBM7412318.1 peptidoglycan/LPS O-acetylase OafA/YrhL [Clavibacter michiganensis]